MSLESESHSPIESIKQHSSPEKPPSLNYRRRSRSHSRRHQEDGPMVGVRRGSLIARIISERGYY